jgi:hypothetical protein
MLHQIQHAKRMQQASVIRTWVCVVANAKLVNSSESLNLG